MKPEVTAAMADQAMHAYLDALRDAPGLSREQREATIWANPMRVAIEAALAAAPEPADESPTMRRALEIVECLNSIRNDPPIYKMVCEALAAAPDGVPREPTEEMRVEANGIAESVMAHSSWFCTDCQAPDDECSCPVSVRRRALNNLVSVILTGFAQFAAPKHTEPLTDEQRTTAGVVAAHYALKDYEQRSGSCLKEFGLAKDIIGAAIVSGIDDEPLAEKLIEALDASKGDG